MIRKIAAVVAGYVAMVAIVIVTFSLAYRALGADGAFRPESYEVSTAWLVMSLIVSAAAAVLGGYACAALARHPAPPKILAGLVLALGLVVAALDVREPAPDPPPVRSGEVSNAEAMQHARQPVWILFLNPLIGAAGVLVGAALRPGNRQGWERNLADVRRELRRGPDSRLSHPSI